jgi:hypothetical protein
MLGADRADRIQACVILLEEISVVELNDRSQFHRFLYLLNGHMSGLASLPA